MSPTIRIGVTTILRNHFVAKHKNLFELWTQETKVHCHFLNPNLQNKKDQSKKGKISKYFGFAQPYGKHDANREAFKKWFGVDVCQGFDVLENCKKIWFRWFTLRSNNCCVFPSHEGHD